MKFFMWIVIIFSGYVLALFFLQRAVLFPRYMIPEINDNESTPPNLEIINLKLPFGSVESWYLPPVDSENRPPHPIAIFAHGNAERIEFCVEEIMPLRRLGIGVLLVEFPGYGRSQGKPSQKTITDTFVAAYDIITRRPDIDPHRVIFYGRSLGGGAVCALLNKRPAAAVILVSTFTSVRSFAKRYLVPSILVRDPFDNLATLRAYGGPVLVVHGRQDEVVPFSHGKTLYRNSQNARFIPYDCGHNDCPPDPASFWREIKVFLTVNHLLE